MKWPWSKKKPVALPDELNCMACRTMLESSVMIHEAFRTNGIGTSEARATVMGMEGVGEHRLMLIAVTGDESIEEFKEFVDRITTDSIVSSACMYGDCFLCNEESSKVRRIDGGRVCECSCHEKEKPNER